MSSENGVPMEDMPKRERCEFCGQANGLASYYNGHNDFVIAYDCGTEYNVTLRRIINQTEPCKQIAQLKSENERLKEIIKANGLVE